MSGSTTRRLIKAYHSMAKPMMHLSGMFSSPAENFHASEEVEVDITRCDEDIAIAVQDLSVGYRNSSDDLYTNKSFKPPIYRESITINAFDLIKRVPGKNPFENSEFRSNLIYRMFKGMTKIENKVRRSIEFQAAQVLQTGGATLLNEKGEAIYQIDYRPKASHFPTVSIPWSDASSNKKQDISNLSEQIRDDGLYDPDELHMGVDAFNYFINDPAIQAVFDNRRIEQGRIVSRQMNGKGGAYRGVVEIGNYKYDIWTYGGRFKNPVTGVTEQYIDKDNVIVKSSEGRLDATFGAIPNIGKILGMQSATSILSEATGRFSNMNGGMDLFTNAWLTNDGEQLMAGVGARPLMIPTAIDTYGCLTTRV